MSFFEAILMGIVQGITEFLPVSSSGHLAVIGRLLNIQEEAGLSFEVLLHVGTLAAVCLAFREDIRRMALELIRMINDILYNGTTYFHNRFHGEDARDYRKLLHNNYRKLVTMLVISTIPTGILGYLMQGIVQRASVSLLATGLGFLVTGVLLFVMDNWRPGKKIPKDMKTSHALAIGICQGLGTFPGVSRLGLTMTAGLMCGLNRGFAVRYSFLLSVPAVIGALILELQTASFPAMSWRLGGLYAAGTVAAAVTGCLVIRWMLNFVKRRKFFIFSAYCFLLGIVTIVCHFVFS
ncbi:MAG TPA: undecaprenyl-diphosphate phosphatase [Candidatus Pullilachnospira stercoravium]|uniref:Undecaprenyl-diphosphatase n=1 Tax=Candidatus Pullilachnospira stercoravium TaxID=2840913 RepID=A0A9D1T6K0_9FIRM|nr:undecaprenyl-diphosphate phosphatase [Candidatus Pullilachnospira stercoravium]